MSSVAGMMSVTGSLSDGEIANEWSVLAYRDTGGFNARTQPNNSFQTLSLSPGLSSNLPPTGYDRLIIAHQTTLNWAQTDFTGGSAAQWNGSAMTKLAEYENTSTFDTTNAFFAIVDNTSAGSQTYGFRRNTVSGSGFVGTTYLWTVLLPTGGTYSIGTDVNQSTANQAISLTAPAGFNSPDATTLYLYGFMTRNGSSASSITSGGVDHLGATQDGYTDEWSGTAAAINPSSATFTATLSNSAVLNRTDLMAVLKLN